MSTYNANLILDKGIEENSKLMPASNISQISYCAAMLSTGVVSS